MTAKSLWLVAAAAGALAFSAAPMTALAQDTAPTTPGSSLPDSGSPESTMPSAPAPDSRGPATSADSAAAPASAAESNWIGAQVYDRKGTLVGRIQHLITGSSGGEPDRAELNVRGSTVVVPTATLTLADGKATSSQSLSEIESSGPEGY